MRLNTCSKETYDFSIAPHDGFELGTAVSCQVACTSPINHSHRQCICKCTHASAPMQQFAWASVAAVDLLRLK